MPSETVNPLDMDNVGRTPYRAPIIKKHPREKEAKFIQRGKGRNILRRCVACGFRRPFDAVKCPMCGSAEFYQVQGDQPDTSKHAAKPGDPLPQPEVPIRDPDAQPEAKEDGGGAYRFEPNPNFDPGVDVKPKAATPVQRPLAEHSVDELRTLAKSHGVNVGNLKDPAKIIERLEQSQAE